ncbi:MAG: MFS transporter [Dehalococcoidia bacterium]|nr:MFS transporter [Dehalococcoidia bacterium]MCB9486930.1 MFS transporter [Thermoflexaceae bacterium]
MTASATALEPAFDDSRKWLAFSAIAISFVTMVMSQSMVFVALSAIADDFGITLRAVTWVVIAQALTISALMMPMGRLADIAGWKRIHLLGLALFAAGAIFIAVSPVFWILIVARVVMAAGNAMGQSVGTAMVVSVFPPSERGMAIGSQTSAVAIGGVSGPIVGGLVLQILPWEALFWLLVIPIGIAFVAGYLILDEKKMRGERRAERLPFDWGGAILSGLAISLLVITINNPFALSWASPLQLGPLLLVVALLAIFVYWEFGYTNPMLELRLFRDHVFSLAVLTRMLGFMATTATLFMMPIYLISFRDMSAGAAGGVLFLTSLGMGVSAQAAGRLSDKFGPRPFTMLGLGMVVITALPMAFLGHNTPIPVVMALLLVGGLGSGLFNVPNNSMILGAAPASALGVVAALTNLTRNVGNVFGQAIASGVIVAVMVAKGFDIPLGDVGDNPAAGHAFLAGWKIAFLLVAAYASVALILASRTVVRTPHKDRAT